MNIIYLHVTTWAKILCSAQHYYGTLKSNDKKVEVLYTLTAEDAARLNKEGDRGYYKPGDTSSRFWSLDALRTAAIEQWQIEFPDALLLIQGVRHVYDPQPVLAGPPEIVDRLNNIVDRCEANDWWEGDEDAMKRLCQEWEAVFQELDTDANVK